MIPMEELEGRLDGAAHVAIVRSALEGGMNTLRVWGGGTFQPDAWYEAQRADKAPSWWCRISRPPWPSPSLRG